MKHVFSEPDMEESKKSFPIEKVLDTQRLLRKWDKYYERYHSKQDYFDSLWIKSYSVIYNSYCSTELKILIQELPNYESEIRENPMKLLETVEHFMHVPMQTVYPLWLL